MTETAWVLLARLVRPQGRKGEVIADIFTDFPQRFSSHPRVFLAHGTGQGKDATREVVIERHWPHQGRIVFKFQGTDSMNDAELLRGLEVVVPANERMPLADDAFYISDLIGCRLIDLAEGPENDIGEILDVERGLGGAPDLLVVQPTVPSVSAVTEVTTAETKDAARPRRGKRAKKLPELLIPFAKLYVVSVDVAAKRVVMRLPAGLTDLNVDMNTSGKLPEGEE